MKKVVVVESPSKAKTINRYLGNDYIVLASYGHIRDLPSKNGSVLPDNDFSMIWEMEDKAKRNMGEISRALKGADALYLATDPDREGEAISWHVQQVLDEEGSLVNKEVKRIVFNEITKNAIKQAIAAPREINAQLVDAYLARRALDYLVGFNLSPILWRKLPGSRSAGRVQSVALRLIVQRENEIEVFVSQEYWSILGNFKNGQNQDFQARLTYYDGKKLDKLDIKNREQAQAICETASNQSYKIGSIDRKQVKRHPAPPFTTSTLQQEASRKLGFSASRTMQIAQRLYEGIDIRGETSGLITYMRTDSVYIADEAVKELRQMIGDTYGQNYVPGAVRLFKNKSKNAQEAHEAIRPTSSLRHPQEVAAYLDPSQLKLYDLIWKRAVASQMESALFDQVGIDIVALNQKLTFRATGSTMLFDGFLKLYQEGVDDKGDEDEEGLLPPMKEGESSSLTEITPNQHFTQPPPRYSEASLVKKLEELGIGRPSTYASIIQVLQDRDYVRLDKRQFIPEERGRLVTSFLVNFFRQYVEYDFTAHMEEQLDDVSNGLQNWRQVLSQFWQAFKTTVDATQGLRITEVIENLERDLSIHLFHSNEESARVCPVCSDGRLSLKLSRFGAFIGCSNYPTCKYTRPVAGESSEENSEPMAQDEPRVIGADPESGENITLRKGPYGFYLQWGEAAAPAVAAEPPAKGKKKAPAAPKPKRVAIPQGVTPATVTLQEAMNLKQLPKTIGTDPESGAIVSVGLGRFGPYVKCGDLFASIPKSEDMFKIELPRALELLAAKQKAGKSGIVRKKAKPKAKPKAKAKA